MPNVSGNAYALTTLCPIKTKTDEDKSATFYTRKVLQDLPIDTAHVQDKVVSPMARVPNTYLARFFILDDAIFQSYPYQLDTLKSSYLVFTANFHGELAPYLKGMYQFMKDEIFEIWKYCYGFDEVVTGEKNGKGESSFVQYIKKCQVETTFYFNGSTDDSLNEQLKSLYLKQELSKFVFKHQGADAAELLRDFKTFIKEKQPNVLESPTWKAGSSNLDEIIKYQSGQAI